MMETRLLKQIIEKESWEEILYYIVSVEKLDPWDIDLVKLADGFIKFLRKVRELDFRIPAKVVFVASILLKIKANYLLFFEEKKEEKEERKVELPEIEIEDKLFDLLKPVKRIPKRPITLEDLIKALRKALKVRERKLRRKKLVEEAVRIEIEEEDISKRMEELFNLIVKKIEEEKRERIRFRDLVKWEREDIVSKFIPLLHLEQQKKIRAEQQELFGDIWICLYN